MIRTDIAVLQILSHGESYGLAIIERGLHLTGGRLELKQGRLYPVLGELETSGLVTSDDRPNQGGEGRPRRYFRLTAAGRQRATNDSKAIANLLAVPAKSRSTNRFAGTQRKASSL